MISKYVNVGDRIDLETIDSAGFKDNADRKTYKSQLFDIEDETRIKIAMPMEQGRVILLQIDDEYNLCFYTPAGLYQCLGRVADRYKSNNVFVLVVDLTSDLRKYQRREYYRLNCVLDMKSTMVTKDAVTQLDEQVHFLDTDLTFDNGTMVDISGGGARFISRVKYPEDSYIIFKFSLFVNGSLTEYQPIGQVLVSKELENRQGEYEHRVKFVNIMNDDRESIIKYIFEEERKNLRREKRD